MYLFREAFAELNSQFIDVDFDAQEQSIKWIVAENKIKA